MCADENRFLVLDGACPGEGVWSWARSYTELVSCVKDAWGHDFTPVFKYKLPCIRTEANAHTRTSAVDATAAAAATDGPQEMEAGAQAASPDPAEALAPSASKGRPATCYVVLNDADDFELWMRGGAYVDTDALLTRGAAADTAPAAAVAAVHHHGSAHESADELLHGVSYHMNRAAEAEASLARRRGPQRLTSVLYAFRSGSGASGEGGGTRASPPVRRADSDIIEVPLQSLLEPAWLVRLGVSAVLRHSTAPAEVILFSAHTPAGQGELPWGALCLKARHAWGVHAPQFRYVDLSHGVTQMLVNHVNDFRAWVRQVRQGNCELLVVEQAATASRGEAFVPATVRAAIHRHYAHEWPEEGRGGASANVVVLVRRLKALEREERIAAVARPGRDALPPPPPAQPVTDRAASAATPPPPPTPPPRDVESSSTGAPTRPATARAPATAPHSHREPTSPMPKADATATETPYRPLLLQPRRPATTPARQRADHTAEDAPPSPTPGTSPTASASPSERSASASDSDSAATPKRRYSTGSTLQSRMRFRPVPLTATDVKIDKAILSSVMDASSYARLLRMLSPSPEHATAAAVSQTGPVPGVAAPTRPTSPTPAAKLDNPNGAVTAAAAREQPRATQPTQVRRLSSAPPNARVRQWVFARSTAAAGASSEEDAAAAAAAAASAQLHMSAPLSEPLYAADLTATARASTGRAPENGSRGAHATSSGPTAAAGDDTADAQTQAQRHQMMIAQHFRAHPTLPSNGRGLGATPVW